MKKTIIFTLLLLLAAYSAFPQTIRRVNTNPAVTGLNVYATIQAAHDAATAGDIIIVEASSISCGNLVATKSIKIYGKGYFTDANSELHVSPNPSLCGNITFDQGSSNSEVSGITCYNMNVSGASNIRIYRNYITNTLLIQAQNVIGTDLAIANIQASQNYIVSYTDITSTTQGISTVSLTNNYMYAVTSSTGNISGMIINNNVVSYFANLDFATFQNNIITYNSGSNQSTFTSCTVENNIALTTQLPAGNGNQNNVNLNDATNGFIVSLSVANNALPLGTSIDERYKLQPGSTLETAGTSGSQVGMYGGPNPYVISGIPGAPSITKLLTPDYGNTAAPLSVTISVKSNN